MQILISFPCPTCLGRGRALNPPTPCTGCNGNGHILTPIEKITPEQATLVRHQLAAIPPDSDTEYETASTREHITKCLTKFYPQAITFPDDAPSEIHLTNSKGGTLRIHPSFKAGKFHHLDVSPIPG